MTNYAKAISQVHFRKGSLLEYNGVYLTEGPWPAKAYFDARRRARSRSAALYMDYGFTYPKPMSRGPYQQLTGQVNAAEEVPTNAPVPSSGTLEKQPSGPGTEVLPAPQPSGVRTFPQPPAPQPSAVRPSAPPPAPQAAISDSAVPVMQDAPGTRDLGALDLGSLAPMAGQAPAVTRDPAVGQAGYRSIDNLGKGLPVSSER